MYGRAIIQRGNAVSILGKGSPTIYINGRNPLMNNAMVMDYLRSLPSRSIDKIEIMPTSGVSHNASMHGGIINIVLKKPEQGLRGSVSAETSYQGERISPRLSNSYASPSRGLTTIGRNKHLLSMSLNKSFADNSTLSLDVINILNYKPSSHYENDSYSYFQNAKVNNTTFQLRYVYLFGSNKIKGASDKSDNKHLNRFR